jgi:hypothetical protein
MLFGFQVTLEIDLSITFGYREDDKIAYRKTKNQSKVQILVGIFRVCVERDTVTFFLSSWSADCGRVKRSIVSAGS